MNAPQPEEDEDYQFLRPGRTVGVLALLNVGGNEVGVSAGSGPWDQLFGGGNSPAFVVAALSAFAARLVALLGFASRKWNHVKERGYGSGRRYSKSRVIIDLKEDMSPKKNANVRVESSHQGDNKREPIAAMHLIGIPRSWYKSFMMGKLLGVTWQQFTQSFMAIFGELDTDMVFDRLKRLQHSNSVENYFDEIEKLMGNC
ncbi:hypothetical protein AgCh_022304 [Apium graveolens]